MTPILACSCSSSPIPLPKLALMIVLTRRQSDQAARAVTDAKLFHSQGSSS